MSSFHRARLKNHAILIMFLCGFACCQLTFFVVDEDTESVASTPKCGEYEACSSYDNFSIGSVLFFPDYGLCNCTEFINTVTIYNSTECEQSTEMVTYSVTLEYHSYEGSSLSFSFFNGSVCLFHEMDTCDDLNVGMQYPASNWSCFPSGEHIPFVSYLFSDDAVSTTITYTTTDLCFQLNPSISFLYSLKDNSYCSSSRALGIIIMICVLSVSVIVIILLCNSLARYYKEYKKHHPPVGTRKKRTDSIISGPIPLKHNPYSHHEKPII